MSPYGNFVLRSIARIRQIFGVTNTTDISSGPSRKPASIHYGMFSESELRHHDGIVPGVTNRELTETDIAHQLKEVTANSKKKIDEIENLKMMAPELGRAETIIISSILSPTDLQTDLVNINVDSPEVSEETRQKINDVLNTYFNDEFKLGSKLADWLKTAGFADGAKAIMIMPQAELDVLNKVADSWSPNDQKMFKEMKSQITHSTESLLTFKSDAVKENATEHLIEVVSGSLESLSVGAEFIPEDDIKKIESKKIKDKDGKEIEISIPKTRDIAKTLVAQSFKLLKTTEDGCGVIVTRDLSDLGKNRKHLTETVDELSAQAERQIRGFDAKNPEDSRPQYPVLTISDIIKTNRGDMPILIEFPAESVIPVCAPGDKKNHIGYFVMVDEYGQPIKGEYVFDGTDTGDITHRLATNAVRSVFGNANISSFTMAGMNEGQMMDNVTKVFSVAVNYLLTSKLKRDGLTGLSIGVHEAVGKSLFFNLLAKNKVKMIFIPASMMIYFRFDHRKDGTGKSMLEDISFILAIRCTLMIANLMSAIEAATKHRTIEVTIDDKTQNAYEALELFRQGFISKKTPNITNDPRTAAESIINSHLTIKPKGMAGTMDDLAVNHETSFGNSQNPGGDLMETINNMIGQGLKLPPTVLNNLNEAEYSKSVATLNLFFASDCRGWQWMIKPEIKKFLINYILSSDQLMSDIKKIIEADINGSSDDKTKDNTSPCIKEYQNKEPSVLLKKIIASVDIVLPSPSMSTTKSQFDELNAEVEALTKLLELIYPDDAAPSDELKSYMSAIRAVVASKIVREFIPKLGVHKMSDIPSIDEVDTRESSRLVAFLANLKRRIDNRTKLATGQLPEGAEAGVVESQTPGNANAGQAEVQTGEGDQGDQGSSIPGFDI